MKMLHGKIHHAVVQQPRVLTQLIQSLVKQLNITDDINVKIEKYLLHELLPGKYLEGHIDVYTNAFLIEIKTTAALLKYWSKDLVDYHLIQLNTYLGLTKQKLGFILLINLRAYFSDVTDFNDVWNKYGCILPVHFDQELFDNTLAKAKSMFQEMERGSFSLPGPEFQWECKYCSKEIQEFCYQERKKNSPA